MARTKLLWWLLVDGVCHGLSVWRVCARRICAPCRVCVACSRAASRAGGQVPLRSSCTVYKKMALADRTHVEGGVTL